MPDKEVQTIKDLLYYQYAKLVAKSTYNILDGETINQRYYGFIKSAFRGFIHGNKSWSEITKEDTQLAESDNKCDYCGTNEGELQQEPIISKSLKIKPSCSTCERIQTIHNHVLACTECNRSKGLLGLYEFYHKAYPEVKWFYDIIPKLIEKKYLKTIYYCHECAGTLDKSDLNGDGELTVLDIDFILHS